MFNSVPTKNLATQPKRELFQEVTLTRQRLFCSKILTETVCEIKCPYMDAFLKVESKKTIVRLKKGPNSKYLTFLVSERREAGAR